jgi:hypothetical protein
MWVLLVFFINIDKAAISMQEFSTQETCQTAGAKMWELSGRRVNWSCVKK